MVASNPSMKVASNAIKGGEAVASADDDRVKSYFGRRQNLQKILTCETRFYWAEVREERNEVVNFQ
jgi:hypothetical protein